MIGLFSIIAIVHFNCQSLISSQPKDTCFDLSGIQTHIRQTRSMKTYRNLSTRKESHLTNVIWQQRRSSGVQRRREREITMLTKETHKMSFLTPPYPVKQRWSLLAYFVSQSVSHDNWCTVGGNGGCRVGEVRAGTTSPMPDHKGFKLQ